jgi:hypothetical protein
MSLDSALPSDWDAIVQQSQRAQQSLRSLDQLVKTDVQYTRPGQPIFVDPSLHGPDVVNSPPHYNNGGVECIDYIQQQLGPERFLGYLEGNTIKYLHRWKYKNGIEDLRKARWYLERLIKEAAKAP